MLMLLVREREDARKGDANPLWTVVEFVEQLVERFLQQIGDEAELSLPRLWDEGWVGRVDGELVGAEELGRDGVLPEGDPGLEVFCVVWAALGEGVECGI